MSIYHIAQNRTVRTDGPMDGDIMAEFKANLDPINALAEQTPGFVWRLKSDGGNNATSIHVYEDEYLLLNMSIVDRLRRCASTPTTARTPTLCASALAGSNACKSTSSRCGRFPPGTSRPRRKAKRSWPT